MNKLPIRCSLCRTSVCQKASLPTLCRKPESQFSSLPTLRQKSSSPILSGCQFAAAHATHQFARNPVRRHVPESQKASSPTHPPSSQLTTDPMPLSPRKLTNSSTKGLKSLSCAAYPNTKTNGSNSQIGGSSTIQINTAK